QPSRISLFPYTTLFRSVSGECMGIEEVNDPTFAQKVLGDGVAILPEEGKVFAPADCTVEMVTDTKHAVGLRTKAGNGILIHVGRSEEHTSELQSRFDLV